MKKLKEVIPQRDKNNQITSEMLQFVSKISRSISEIQEGANSVADVFVFLELLGISDRIAKEKGFSGLSELSRYVYNFVEFYEENKYGRHNKQMVAMPQNHIKETNARYGETTSNKTSTLVKIPSFGEKLIEALSFYSPWLAAIILLNITGSSLWMVTTLPAGINTAFISGVFLGLVLTEGIMQTSGRVLTSSFSQKNLSEFKRTLLRTYLLMGIILASTTSLIIIIGSLMNFPLQLAMILVGAMVSISLHRTSFLVMYALKKFRNLIASYAGGFLSLLGVFYLLPDLIPDFTTRYFLSLGVAFAVLSSFAVYYHYKIIKGIGPSLLSDNNLPNFYNPPAEIKNSIKSVFKVQVWESIPYFVFGTFYFVLLFTDRVLSWLFNDFLYIASNGTVLPMVFNSDYHAGADIALLILIPTIIIQHVVMAPIHHMARNKLTTLTISDTASLNRFLRGKYVRLMIITLMSSLIPAILINVFGEELMVLAKGSETSLKIMQYASVANVLLSIFMANSLFITFLNKAKIPAVIVFIGALIIIIAGGILGRIGYEKIILAYLLASIIVSASSTLFAIKIIKNSGMRFLARYS
ncbi:MAG TPA: hypothetical protein VLD38_01180 [Nitrosopumilaceae archaeon]|nr:hypothetical protein [Nitrosopumilaceae archaeon]